MDKSHAASDVSNVTNTAQNSTSRYRPEIDGLRALAVGGVVVEHAFRETLTGGYVGVDVFFVISGYLIGRILLNEFSENRFSLTRFYYKRATRIIPALTVVCLACTVGVLAIFSPPDIALYGRSLVATAFFSSNFFFFMQAGYFAPASQYLPLLHTWSLAIEEQFYLVFPLVIWLAYKVGRVRLIFAAGWLSSFALSCLVIFKYPEGAYYLLPTRGWELLTGACIALLPSTLRFRAGTSEFGAVVGLALICGSMAVLNSTSMFPGAAALPTCIGAAILIGVSVFGRSTVLSVALSNPVSLFVGKISYSLYLWHWPIMVAARYTLGEPSFTIMISCIVLSIALASVTWWWVERAFHRSPAEGRAMRSAPPSASTKVSLMQGAAALLFVAAIGGTLSLMSAPSVAGTLFGNRIVRYMRETSPYNSAKGCIALAALTRTDGACVVGDPAKPRTIALWGDSFADALIPGLQSVLRNRSASTYIMRSCPSILGARRVDDRPEALTIGRDCLAFNQAVFRKISEDRKIETVILFSSLNLFYDYPEEGIRLVPNKRYNSASQRTAFLNEALLDTVRQLRVSGKKVVVVGAYYTGARLGASSLLRELRVNTAADRRFGVPAELFNAFSAPTNSRLASLSDPGVIFIDPRRVFCREPAFCQYVDGAPLLTDGKHIGQTGSRLFAKQIEDKFSARRWSL